MKAYYHLPGLFEFYELYKEFLPLYRKHREYFYDWCDIGSIYGAPADCIWGGGRVGFGEHDPKEVLKLMQEYGISARLTFSNSLLTKEHLSDKKCNELCRIFDIGRDNERSRGFGNDNDISGINKRIKVKECRNGIIIINKNTTFFIHILLARKVKVFQQINEALNVNIYNLYKSLAAISSSLLAFRTSAHFSTLSGRMITLAASP